MPLLSAWEDFTKRTLSGIPGLLSRLVYVIGLRDENGNYRHWGLARTHGTIAASEAMGRAHLELLTEVLRTPLPRLMQELEETEQIEIESPMLLRSLVPGATAAVHAATASHAKATILALRALKDAEKRRPTIHRAA